MTNIDDSLHLLTPFNALQAGVELWFVADLKSSKWARKIDWYLNCQLSRGFSKAFKSPSPALLEIADKWDFVVPQIAVGPSPALMIASHDLVPNRMTVLISSQKTHDAASDQHAVRLSANEWSGRIKDVWQNLGAPTCRIFPPDDMNLQSLANLWRDVDPPKKIELVAPFESADGRTV